MAAAQAARQRRKGAQREQARENDRGAMLPGPARSPCAERSFGLPHVSEAPPGARPVDAGGRYAVAMALHGEYVGMFRREPRDG